MKRSVHIQKRYQQKAMTLIELVVVLAIVAILALIAFNELGDQGDKGYRAEGVSALMVAVQEFEACGRDSGGDFSACVIPAAFVNSVNNRFVVTVAAQTATTYMISVTRLTGIDEQCLTMSIDHLGQKYYTGIGNLERCWSST